MIARNIVLFLFLSIVSIIIGCSFLEYIGWEAKIYSALSWGFTALFALFFIISYPLYMIGSSFSLLFWLFSIAELGLFLWSLSFLVKNNQLTFFRKEIQLYVQNFRQNKLLSILAVCAIVIGLWLTVGYYHATSDDGYYLPRSMEVIRSNSLAVPTAVSWYGEEIPGYHNLTDASVLSSFISYLTYLTGINATILCRSGFAVFSIAVHYSSFLTLADSVLENRNNYELKSLSVIFYTIFIFFAEKVCSAGVWLSQYIWQGKSLLSALVFPLLFASCSNLIKRINISKTIEWLSVFLVFSAGIGISTVGMFLPVILFFGIGTSFMFATQFRYFRSVWIPALLSMLPVIICAVISYCSIVTTNTFYLTIGQRNTWSWKEQFFRAFDIPQLISYMCSVLYYLVKGNKLERILFVYTPTALLLTFINPFFAEFVSSYVTTKEVYWRIFWIIPVYIVPALAFSKLFMFLSSGKPARGIVLIGAFIAVILSFEWKTYYSIKPNFSDMKSLFHVSYPRRENLYSLSPENVIIAEKIIGDYDGNKRPRLLTAYDSNFEIRQYSSEIIEEISWCGLEKADLFNCITDGNELLTVVSDCSADYVCFQRPKGVCHPENYGFEFVCAAGEMELWKVPDSEFSES